MCKIVANIKMLVEQCALMHIYFWKHRGCALIEACALITTNMVSMFVTRVLQPSWSYDKASGMAYPQPTAP